MYLHGLGHFHPENVITNEFLEGLDIDTTCQWIEERVGIRSRHTVLPLDYIKTTKNADPRAALEAAVYSNAETGAKAARMALQRAGISASEIGMVVAGGCSPDECIPAEACRIAQEMEIDCPGLDIGSACSSFCAQLYFLEGMRPERLPDYILVVNPENSTRVVDYRDRSTCVLWGDASSAAVVSPHIPGPWKIGATLLRGDPSGADKVRVPRMGHFTQSGPAVQSFAIRRASETFVELRRRFWDLHPDEASHAPALIGHQANLRMLEAVLKRADVAPERHFFNVDRRGNTGAAGAPSVMSENWGNAALGDAVILSVVGSGLTWAGTLLERTASEGLGGTRVGAPLHSAGATP